MADRRPGTRPPADEAGGRRLDQQPVAPISVAGLAVCLGGQPILSDISFEIGAGQTVALLGDNGSGKSTLIRAILGLVRHQAGSVALLGTDLARFTAWHELGYVPQRASVSLHSTTVAEVVASGVLANRPIGWRSRQDRAKVAWALESVGLSDRSRELYLHLSGGQQQRVLIARGMVNRPRLLILDEPFAGVDLVNQAEIATTLAGLDATILVVLHETEAMADRLDRILTLRQGRLIDDTAPESGHRSGGHETEAPPRARLLTGMEPRWNS